MILKDQAVAEINRSINTLRRRYANSVDTEEKASIKDAIKALNESVQELNQAALLDVAKKVSDSADVLERVVGSTRLGPFDGYLSALEGHLRALGTLNGEVHSLESLVSADDGPDLVSTRPTTPTSPIQSPTDEVTSVNVAETAGTQSRTTVNTSTVFAEFRQEYETMFESCVLLPKYKSNLDYYLSRLNKYKSQYETVAKDFSGMPWHFVGIIHAMEAGFDFAKHFHNGDPLTARTVNVPSGRPAAGQPPFTWKESAEDALVLKKSHDVTDWSIPHILFLLEKFNGFGYRFRGLPTPYLWSFSNHYQRGKFVADRVYDPNAVSKQCGAGVILKYLQL